MKESIPSKYISFFFLVIMVTIVTCFLGCSEDKGNSSTESNHVTPVKVIKAEKMTLKRTIALIGTVEPWREVDIVPNISGKVERIYADAGDIANKGDVLAELDTRSIKLQIEQAEAAVSVARSNLDDAELNYKRMKNLSDKGTISPQQYEKVELAYNAAQAQLKQAEANLKLAKYHLDVAVMNSPFAGVIARRNMNEGETINPMMPGSKGVVTLMDIARLKITTHVTEKDIKEIRTGLKVTVKVDAYPDTVFAGETHTVSPAANQTTRSFEVEVKIPNPGWLLKPGMFARLEIIVDEKKDVTVIPIDALIEQENEIFVFVVEDGIARKRTVTTGIREKDHIEILNGLSETEQVIIFGKDSIMDGSRVTIGGGEQI